MRETRPSGSEGGGVVQPVLPTPIALIRSSLPQLQGQSLYP